ncbi:MAG TPA: hypothetical protein PKM11_03825 [Methanomassiliicoccales archaeon]|nr:hypothetical protein [Methanomassiliicoccales archaeon]
MVERVRSRSTFSASSRSKFIKKDREGVASTIGTIMALLVFLTLIAMFTNTYIPVWMKENERDHMDQVLSQFGDLKGKIDTLIVNAQVTQRPTINMFQPLSLGSDSVPVFTSPTGGFLYLKPMGTYDTGVTVGFNYNYSNSLIKVNEEGGGCVEYYAPNRYFVQQWYGYENGALMVYQKDGVAMRASPSLVFIKNSDSTVNLQFDQVDMIGSNESVSGMGTAGIVIDLIYHDSQTYVVSGATGAESNGPVVLKFTTRYVSALWSHLNQTAAEAGMISGVSGNYTLTSKLVSAEGRNVYELTLTVFKVNEFTHNRAYVNLDLEY